MLINFIWKHVLNIIKLFLLKSSESVWMYRLRVLKMKNTDVLRRYTIMMKVVHPPIVRFDMRMQVRDKKRYDKWLSMFILPTFFIPTT